jgi:hypothetical protein
MKTENVKGTYMPAYRHAAHLMLFATDLGSGGAMLHCMHQMLCSLFECNRHLDEEAVKLTNHEFWKEDTIAYAREEAE